MIKVSSINANSTLLARLYRLQ